MNAFLMFDSAEGFMGETLEGDKVQNRVIYSTEANRIKDAARMARNGYAVLLEINGKTTQIFPATPGLF